MDRLLGQLAHATIRSDPPEMEPIRSTHRYLPRLHQPLNRNYFLDGERGSGKSTVLISLLDRLNAGWSSPQPVDGVRSNLLPLRPVALEHVPKERSLQLQVLQGFRRLVKHLSSEEQATTLLDVEPDYLATWRALCEAVALAYGTPMAERRAAVGVSQYVAECDDVEARLGDLTELYQHFVEALATHLEATDSRKNVQFLLSLDDLDMCPERVDDIVDTLRVFKSPRVCNVVTGSWEQFEAQLQRAYEIFGRERRDALASAVMRKLIPPAQRVELQLTAIDRVDSLLDGLENDDVDLRYRLIAAVDCLPATMRELADVQHQVRRYTNQSVELFSALVQILTATIPEPNRILRVDGDGRLWSAGPRVHAQSPRWLQVRAGGLIRIAGSLVKVVAAKRRAPSDARAAALVLYAFTDEHMSRVVAGSLGNQGNAALGGTIWMVSTSTKPQIPLPVPLAALEARDSLSVWGRWWYAHARLRPGTVLKLIIWGLASLRTSESALPLESEIETIIAMGKAHPVAPIKSWFETYVYLLCLPEWRMSMKVANRLWVALGPPPIDFDLNALSVNVIAKSTVADASGGEIDDVVKEIEAIRRDNAGYEAVLSLTSAASNEF